MKNILLVDDSALMRRVTCDIIKTDPRFQVADIACDGLAALELLQKKTYDVVILDINMPKMNGLELLRELRRRGIAARVLVFSTESVAGAAVTIEALSCGALDFCHKPNYRKFSQDDFKEHFFEVLTNVSEIPLSKVKRADKPEAKPVTPAPSPVGRKSKGGRMAVAVASSTGGPKALHQVIPYLPANLAAPVFVVQHMPVGFTASLAERLDSLSKISCTEAKDQEEIRDGHVYFARGGKHLKYRAGRLCFSDEPPREGVKPCANYLYESLAESSYDEIVCVVLTGMGADGTKGILELKKHKKLHIIAQSADSCTVYGMPKCIADTGLVDQVLDLDYIAQEIILKVGVK